MLGANTMGCAMLLAQLNLAQKAWSNPELLQLSTEEEPCWPAAGSFPSAEWLGSLHSMEPLTLTEPLTCAVAVLRGVLTQAAANPAAQGQKYYHTWHRQAVDLVEILHRWLNLLLTAVADQGPSSSRRWLSAGSCTQPCGSMQLSCARCWSTAAACGRSWTAAAKLRPAGLQIGVLRCSVQGCSCREKDMPCFRAQQQRQGLAVLRSSSCGVFCPA